MPAKVNRMSADSRTDRVPPSSETAGMTNLCKYNMENAFLKAISFCQVSPFFFFSPAETVAYFFLESGFSNFPTS